MMPNSGCKGFYRLLFTIFLSMLLVACGSGSSSSGAGNGETPSLSVSNASVTEGDDGTSNLNFTVSLSAQASNNVTVAYATSDGTATAGSDYTTSSGTLTISAGSTSGTVIVSVTGDTDVENNETLTLTLSNPNGASLRTATATGTINNDDSETSLPTINITSANVTEGDSGTSNLSFTVSLSTQASSDVMVDYATSNGTATAGIDYTATNGTLTISAGSTSNTVTVSVTGDTDVENNETLTLTLSNPNGASLGSALATGTITNDDAVTSSSTISIAAVSVTEGDSATSDLTFTISLSTQASSNVTVGYATSNGTATAGIDYTAINGTLTIQAGNTSGSVTVSIIGDTDVESDETFTLTLSNPNGASLGTAIAIGTINNDDSAVLPTISLTDGSVTEGDSGTSDLTFTISLSAQASSDVTVGYATSNGTAMAGSDYTAINGTLTIPAGNTSGTVTVSITGDTDVESDETFTLTLSNPSGASLGTATAIGTINNDDSAVLPSISLTDGSVTEGDIGTSNFIFTISLSAQSSNDVTVDYATSDSTAMAGSDYTTSNGTLTIPAGNTSGSVTVSIIGDTDVENDETFTLTLSNPNGASLGTATATGTINDDDSAATLLPTVNISDASVTEGDTDLSFTVSLSAQSSNDVTVDYATSDGTAIAGSDYTAINDTLTIPAGSTSGTVTVRVTGDTDVESNETLTLTLNNANGVILGTMIATGTINDDDSTVPLPSGSVSGLFYNSGSISMVDLANISGTPVMVETSSTVGESGLWGGAVDVAGQRVTDLHIRTIIYGTADGIYKVSTLKGDSKTPVQVSNETGVADMCEYEWASDFADHNNTIYIYVLPGADSSCGTFDDEWKMVRVGMDATVSPIAAKAMDLEIYDTSTGAITGFLAFEGDKIIRCDKNFQSCTDVISFVTEGEVLEDNPFMNAAILWIDDKLYHYNTATGALSAALYTFSGGVAPSSIYSDTDGTHLYFADGNTLYKLPLDGSANASVLTTAIAAGEVSEINLTANRVVYLVSTLFGSMNALESVSKTGGVATTLSPAAPGFVSVQTAGGFVYFNRISPAATGPIFGVINDDGTGGKETQDAQMAGFFYSSTQGVGEFIHGRIVWTEGCSLMSCAGGTVKSIDAVTNSGEIVLGSIPQDLNSITFGGINNEALGLGVDGAGGSDIFFVNGNLANSLERITTTPAMSERLIF